MNKKNLYIYTIGCQMNVYDSEMFARILEPLDYIQTDSLEEADLVIVNTCSIRKKAEEKAFSFLGRTQKLKKKNPELIVAIGGCVAQQEGRNIISRIPAVDIVFGTDAIPRLPKIVQKVETTGDRVIDVEVNSDIAETMPVVEDAENATVSKFVTIMRGCDNYCTYCIVPYVRGREKSREPDNIIQEITNLVATGTKDITLLGQNVNSYGLKESMCSFPELLKKVSEIKGLERIRYATSHPKDMSDELINAYREIDKLCSHVHLPVQSGSDKILKKMNRKYTREIYMNRIQCLKEVRPDIAVTSDFIVGFPGETDEDFKETLALIEAVEFDGLYAFKYSDRPNAPAVEFEPKVPEDVARKRLEELLQLESRISKKRNQAYVGKICQVLVEGQSKRKNEDGKNQWSGRTSSNKIVNFALDVSKESKDVVGHIFNVEIKNALEHSLWGIEKEV